MEENSESRKSIRGLSFKNIVEKEESQAALDDFPQNHTFFKKAYWKFNRFVLLVSKKVVFVKFILDFVRYIVVRSRVVVAILAILSDLISSYFDFLKRFFVTKLFWGRGKLLRFTAQFLGILLVLLTFISYIYKTATFDSADPTFQNVYASQSDLLIQTASTNTERPRDRSRMDEEQYIVKVGDTLGSIAEYYGLNTETILWANDLVESSLIRPGDSLNIPPGNGLKVEVKSGDNLETLAKTYDSSPQMIIDVNWLDYPFELQVGQQLFIPDGKKPAPVAKPTAPIYSGIIRQRAGALTSSPTVPGVGRFINWPVAGGGRLIACYTGWHNGIDISGDIGTNLVAAAPGVVTFAGCQSGGCPPPGSLYGGWGLAWTVVIDHGNGFSSVYGHMRNIYVSSGQSVVTGQSLGEMGATGTAYGVHIHFMLLQGGSWRGVNPAPYMTTSVCGY
jgi:murein DD-endopeptidase MepM/ murein hydrolase activator NlpD